MKYQFKDKEIKISKWNFSKKKKTYLFSIIISLILINGVTAYFQLATLNEDPFQIIPSNMELPIKINDSIIWKVESLGLSSKYDNLTWIIEEYSNEYIDNYTYPHNNTKYLYQKIEDIFYYNITEDLYIAEVNITEAEPLFNNSYYNINITDIIDEYTIRTDLNVNDVLLFDVDILEYSYLHILNGSLSNTYLDIISLNVYYNYLEIQVNSSEFTGFITNGVLANDVVEILPHDAYPYAINFPELNLFFKPKYSNSNNTFFNMIAGMVVTGIFFLPLDLNITDIYYDTDAIAETFMMGYDIYQKSDSWDVYQNTTTIAYPDQNSFIYNFTCVFSGQNLVYNTQIDATYNLSIYSRFYNHFSEIFIASFDYNYYEYNISDPTIYRTTTHTGLLSKTLIYTTAFPYPPTTPIEKLNWVYYVIYTSANIAGIIIIIYILRKDF